MICIIFLYRIIRLRYTTQYLLNVFLHCLNELALYKSLLGFKYVLVFITILSVITIKKLRYFQYKVS